jgi:2-oxoisovalerate dehydrogenase E1 component
VHEDKVFGGFGGELASRIGEECFLHLDAPVVRVGQRDLPTPFARVLEAAMQLSADQILGAIRQISRY